MEKKQLVGCKEVVHDLELIHHGIREANHQTMRRKKQDVKQCVVHEEEVKTFHYVVVRANAIRYVVGHVGQREAIRFVVVCEELEAILKRKNPKLERFVDHEEDIDLPGSICYTRMRKEKG